jgi:hypothetical protein
MANKKVPAQGGSARGHSNMEHGLHSAEIKDSARKARRREDDDAVAEQRFLAVAQRIGLSPSELLRPCVHCGQGLREHTRRVRRVDAGEVDSGSDWCRVGSATFAPLIDESEGAAAEAGET